MGIVLLALMMDCTYRYHYSIGFHPGHPGQPANLELEFQNGPYLHSGPIDDNFGRTYLKSTTQRRANGERRAYYYCNLYRIPPFCPARFQLDSKNRVINHNFVHNH